MSTPQNTVTATTTRSMMSFRDFQSILRRNCSNELDSNNNSDSDSDSDKAEQVWVEASINQWNIIEKYNSNNNDDDDDVSFPFLLESHVQGSSGYARKKDLISRFLVPNHDDDGDDENANNSAIVSTRSESTHTNPVDIFQKYIEDLEVIYNSEDKSVYMLNQLKKKTALKIRQQILNDDSIIGGNYVLHPLLPMCKLSYNFMKNLSGHFGSSEQTNNNNDENNNNDFGDVLVKPIKFIVQLSQNKQHDQNRDNTKLVSTFSEPQTMSDIHTKVKSTFPSIRSSVKDFWDMCSVSSSSESDTTTEEKEILPSLYNSTLCSVEPYRNGNYIHLKFDPSLSSSRTDDSEKSNNDNSCSVVNYEKVITKADLLSFISILAWNNEVLYIEYQHRIVLL